MFVLNTGARDGETTTANDEVRKDAVGERTETANRVVVRCQAE